MAKILGKKHSPYVPDADTHSLTLKTESETFCTLPLKDRVKHFAQSALEY